MGGMEEGEGGKVSTNEWASFHEVMLFFPSPPLPSKGPGNRCKSALPLPLYPCPPHFWLLERKGYGAVRTLSLSIGSGSPSVCVWLESQDVTGR